MRFGEAPAAHRGQVAVGGEACEVYPERRARKQRLERRSVVLQLHRLEPGEALGLCAPARRREDVDHAAAAKRAARGLVAHDEAVAAQRADRALEHELDQARGAGSDRVLLQDRDAARDVRRAQMHVHGGPVRERLRLLLQHAQPGVDARRRRRHRARDDPVAALDGALLLHAGEVERQALAGAAALRLGVLRVDRAHARRDAGNERSHFASHRDLAAHGRAGDYQPGARDAEAAIDAQPEVARDLALPDRFGRSMKVIFQCFHPKPGNGGKREQRRAREGG
ncbi:MAG TPA: hypothetical protein VML57_20450 [Burkholderiales bacterium]|nr:hypothetical protein [Burkholderiales bacterium]